MAKYNVGDTVMVKELAIDVSWRNISPYFGSQEIRKFQVGTIIHVSGKNLLIKFFEKHSTWFKAAELVNSKAVRILYGT